MAVTGKCWSKMPWTLCWRLETSVGWQLKTGLPDLPIRPFECLHCSFGRIFFWQTSRETLEISRYVFSYYQFGIQLGKWILSRPDHSLLRANLTSIFVGHPHRGLSWFRVKLSHSTWWDQTYNHESYIRKISTPCAAFGFFFAPSNGCVIPIITNQSPVDASASDQGK